MATKLSEDDLFCIFDFFYSDRDLRSLCLCCKLFNQLLQPRLFYRIALFLRKDPRQKSTSFWTFGRLLKRSPHLACYPRQVKITLGLRVTEDMLFVLAALTGKRISFVELTTDGYKWASPTLKRAVETFLRNTITPLNVNLSGLQGLSASCLCSTRNVTLNDCVIDSTSTPSACGASTLSMMGFGRYISFGALFSNVLPSLTHLMLMWEAPVGEPGGWYADLGAALANMPKLVLLTVDYCGGCTKHEYLEAYASKIQHPIGNRADRVSLNWRFLHPMEANEVRVLESLRSLTGWNVISFQVDISHHVGEELIRVATETFLKYSDNYYVRIDELHPWSWQRQFAYHTHPNTLEEPPHLSTLVINGNTLDTVERHVHEDACSHPVKWRECFNPGHGRWETRTIRI